jgi:hypothetical protein
MVDDHGAVSDGRGKVTERGTVHVIRSRSRLLISGAIALLAASLGLAQLGYMVLAEAPEPAGNLGAFAILTAIAVFLGVLLVRPRLVVSNGGIHVVNVLGTTFVPWRDVEALAVGPTRFGPSLQIVRRDGRWVAADAIQPARIPPLSGRRPFVDRVAQELDYLAKKNRLADGDPAPGTARAGEGPFLVSAVAWAICVVGLLVAGLATS